ncbi:hypothetical protein PHJA_001494400 [Phtheirospermum japonicum]|uniref:Uncharacterized protein n=1 Tax=Phtheirospermum japonicum TaxID=374723 RepID=A0A830C1I3_9LAMI|nr:hypothetical protein PHJA_001494400 [Phtheirospermum japonicum]
MIISGIAGSISQMVLYSIACSLGMFFTLFKYGNLVRTGKAQGCITGICSFASIVSPIAFSPLTGLSRDHVALQKLYNFEVLHARWAMLAALGALIPEIFDLIGAFIFLNPFGGEQATAKLKVVIGFVGWVEP